ncbi:hypothetical protein DPMN_184969 [Dreissena polymorpha]|uniref:Uncharacterized protein n=1 Tax=Dreissena polymorpha TaxID=45954 RepID=A0A9D4I537_DREPO|nr:hypothetical protein DPMN_184969 [Dreissena polymorpha]
MVNDHSITKVIQLYETKTSRHSVMIVGGTQSAKSTTWKVLQGSMTALNKVPEMSATYQVVKVITIIQSSVLQKKKMFIYLKVFYLKKRLTPFNCLWV